MQCKESDLNFKFIAAGLWLPFILGIIKVFITNSTSPFFAKIFLGLILGLSYIPVYLPAGIIFIGFVFPAAIKLISNEFAFRKFVKKHNFRYEKSDEIRQEYKSTASNSYKFIQIPEKMKNLTKKVKNS